MKLSASDRPLVAGALVLLAGQVLFPFGFGGLYVVALVWVLAVGLPYPPLFRSLLARVVAAVLLVLSIIQVAAAAQFLAFPNSRFGTLSWLVTAGTLGLLLATHRLPCQKWSVLCSRVDAAAGVAALFFVVPFAVLCFWQNDPANITAFASTQSPDGSSHYIAIAEMASTQHLSYRAVQYYPKGFHIASALALDGLHLNQRDQDWATNARVYVLMYVFWGAVLAYLVVYVAARFWRAWVPDGRAPVFLLAVSIGPALACLYLFLFTFEGFLNYEYVCAAMLLGLLFLFDGVSVRQRLGQWFLVVQLLLAFGIAMSWGPLLTPLLVASPTLYALNGRLPSWQVVRAVFSRRYAWLSLAFAAQLVPLYLHFAYARLSSQQGLDATGDITVFHYGMVLLGAALTAYLALSRRVSPELRQLAVNILAPFLALVGLLAALQLLTAGELRYYSIKTAYLLEIVTLVLGAVTLVVAAHKSLLTPLQRWIVLPVVVSLSVLLLAGITGNPLTQARRMFAGGRFLGHVATAQPDVGHFTQLGMAGQLDSTNSVDLHYDAATARLFGNAPLNSWANLMQYTTDSTPEAGLCSGRIFTLEAFDGAQSELIAAIRDCIAQAAARRRPYFIVTDAVSAPHLRDAFGAAVTYVE